MPDRRRRRVTSDDITNMADVVREANAHQEEEEEEVVWSWGAGTDGQLGTGFFNDELRPQRLSLSLPESLSLLSCGGAHVVALSSGGRVFAWGRGSSGQLGHGDVVSHCVTPTEVPFPDSAPITNVSAGWNHSGFVSASGDLFTCGDGSFGQLGHGNFCSQCYPTCVSYFACKNVGQVACGLRHTVVLLKDEAQNQVYGFGSCKRGQIGSCDAKRKSTCTPQTISGFENVAVVSVSANGDHSATISADGSLYCWGRGFPGYKDCHSPRRLDPFVLIKQVALGWNHAIILTDTGEVLMLGGRRHGNLSDPEKMVINNIPDTGETVLERIPSLDGVKVVDISAGSEHSALVTGEGAMKTWGWGEHGQLGLGDAQDQIAPQDMVLEQGPFAGRVKCRVYCGSGFTYAIRTINLPSKQ